MNLLRPFLIAAASISLQVHAQSTVISSGNAAQENLKSLVNGSAAISFDNRYEGVRGTPYLVAAWVPGTIQLASKVHLPETKLKYDANQRLLLMLRGPKDSTYVDMNKIEGFVLRDPTRTQPRAFQRFYDAPDPVLRREYFEVLAPGNYSFLKLQRKTLQKASYSGAYSADRRYDELLDQTDYYIRTADGRLQPLKLNSKALQAALPEHAAQIQVELKKRPALRTEADFVALIPWLNTLPALPAK
ncbi:hypothetical protein SAMN00120144_1246 [Hymenobacter roseosalivarius DSM 11622]|uniref:Uncharacterized protein n=1 Tax=Hymenobacter roseosalivarius DSM 11622 TaxID=645990 RepID=A0A1W1W4C3_9BACT|nr:hypothetical protein [Hymenobacter roseosalivarius]SMC00492.1 hypothetical protein SAMN00120144_1246 [Hymenobacter roseosalivarius DSM 11622]